MPVLGRHSAALPARVQQAMAAREAALGRDRYQPARTADDRVCAASGCNAGWTLRWKSRPWKARNRPMFEQEFGCSTRCLTTLVTAAVRRETGDSLQAASDEPHRHRVPLGLVLLAQGWITHPQLQTALQAQRASGRGRIGDWLTESCGLDEERITRGLGVQWNCPVLAADGFSPSAMALAMPKRLVAEFGMVPLRIAGSSLLYLAFADRPNASLELGLEQMSGLRVESGLLSGRDFETARKSVLEAEAVAVEMKVAGDRDALIAGIVKVLELKEPVAARLVRVHQYFWLRMWLESGALQGAGGIPPSAEDVQDVLLVAQR